MTFFDNILGFITDSNRRLSTKATVIVLTLFSVFLIDNLIGFSYYYNKERQLDQLKSISLLLQDTTLTDDTRTELIQLQKMTFKRKDIVDYSIDFVQNISWTSVKDTEKLDVDKKLIRNDFWFLASTSGIYILVTILIIPILLLTDKRTSFLKLIATLIIFSLVMFFTSWFNYWLFDKIIPDRLFGSWTWNYIINFVIQISLIIGLYWATNVINRSTTTY